MHMLNSLPLVLAGLGVGFMVGMTGVGGGSLMTPILVFVFGQAPMAAVGTDLFFACVTKSVGTAAHQRHRSVNWRIVGLLAAGSLPSSLLTLLALWWVRTAQSKNVVVMALLGGLILLTGAQMLGLWRTGRRVGPRPDLGERYPLLTVACGALLGALVTLTSIGAGALGVVMLRALYPKTLPTPALVGSDLAHAIPLTLVAGVGYLSMGRVESATLGWLLLGSIPGVLLGSMLPSRLPEVVVRRALGCLLVLVGAKTLAASWPLG